MNIKTANFFEGCKKISRGGKKHDKKKTMLREMREKREIMMENWCLANTHESVSDMWNTYSEFESDFNVVQRNILPALFLVAFFGSCLLWCVWIIGLGSLRCNKEEMWNWLFLFTLHRLICWDLCKEISAA